MSLTSYGCHYSHRNYSHGSDVYRSKTGLKRSSACAKVNPWRVISVAYQRVGQQTGKSQAYLFVPWTAMPVLSLLLILSHFPKECCGCCTDQGLLVASSLVPLGSGEGCCGQKHAVAEPDPLFTYVGMQLGVASALWMRCPFCGWKLHQKFIAEDSWATRQQPAVPGRVLLHSLPELYPGSSLLHCQLIHRKDSCAQPGC